MLPEDGQIRPGRVDADNPMITYFHGLNFVAAIFGSLSIDSRHLGTTHGP